MDATQHAPGEMDEKEFKAKLAEYDRRKAVRQVESYIADTQLDATRAVKPGQSTFQSFVSCDDLRVSIEGLRESVSSLMDMTSGLDPATRTAYGALAGKADVVEIKALDSVSPTCKAQLKRALDNDKPQPAPPTSHGLV